VILAEPLTEGFQIQVATLFGALPEVMRSLQLEILFPFTKNLTIPVTGTVREIVELRPLNT
jgi:hypothetical protein